MANHLLVCCALFWYEIHTKIKEIKLVSLEKRAVRYIRLLQDIVPRWHQWCLIINVNSSLHVHFELPVPSRNLPFRHIHQQTWTLSNLSTSPLPMHCTSLVSSLMMPVPKSSTGLSQFHSTSGTTDHSSVEIQQQFSWSCLLYCLDVQVCLHIHKCSIKLNLGKMSSSQLNCMDLTLDLVTLVLFQMAKI